MRKLIGFIFCAIPYLVLGYLSTFPDIGLRGALLMLAFNVFMSYSMLHGYTLIHSSK